MYDPKIGRFLSTDPLLEMFPEQTPYQYAFNSPLIWKDPSGLKGEKERADKMMGYVEETLELGEYVVVYLYYQTNDDGYCNPLVPYNKSLISKNIYRKSRDDNDEIIRVADNNPVNSGIKSSGGGFSSLGSGVVYQGGINSNVNHDVILNGKSMFTPSEWKEFDYKQNEVVLPPLYIRKMLKNILKEALNNKNQKGGKYEAGGVILRNNYPFLFSQNYFIFRAENGNKVYEKELCNKKEGDIIASVNPRWMSDETRKLYSWIRGFSEEIWAFHTHPDLQCGELRSCWWPSPQDETAGLELFPNTTNIVFGIGTKRVFIFKGNRKYSMPFYEFFGD